MHGASGPSESVRPLSSSSRLLRLPTYPLQELALGRISLCELKLGEVTRHGVELNDGTGRAELDIELLYELVST